MLDRGEDTRRTSAGKSFGPGSVALHATACALATTPVVHTRQNRAEADIPMEFDRESSRAAVFDRSWPGSSRAAGALAVLLAVASLAIVLGGVRSTIHDLDRHAVPKELVLHATALIALLVLVRRWRRLELDVVQLPLIAFLAWSALSALFATSHWIALRALAITCSGIVIFVTSRFIVRHRGTPIVLAGLAVAAVTGALIGNLQAWGVELAWLADDRPPGGTFGNRNFLAHFTAIALPILLLLGLRARSLATTALAAGGLVICMNLLVLTRSRAAWLGAAAALIVFMLALAIAPALRSRRAPRRLLSMPAALAAGILLAIALPNRLEWRSAAPYSETLARMTDYRQGSGRGRLIQYRNTLGIVRMDPVLGAGPGNWFVKYPLVTTRDDPSFNPADPIPTNPWPSSDWLALLAERGALAVLMVLATGAAMLLVAFRRLRGDDADAAPPAAALAAVLAATAVTGSFDAVLLNSAPVFLVAVAAGVLLPATRPVIDRPFHGPRRRATIAGMVAFAVIVTAYSAVQFASIRVTSDARTRATIERAARIDPTSYRLHLDLARRGNCTARIPHARAAARLLPWHETPREALRRCGQ